jgi:hypothetical protein
MSSGPNRTLKLSFVGETKALTKATEIATGSLSKLGDGLKKFGKVAAAGAAAAGVALAAFAKKSVDAAIEAEAAQTRLTTILGNTGLATQEQIKALNDQAAALEKVGVASSGNITVLQAQLATFDLSAETIKTLTPAITDYVIAEKGATATASDFQSAANGLAQALQGNFGALTRTGFVLDDTTKNLIANGTEAERAAALVEVLGSTYEGFNEAARETSEGQLQALKNSFGSLQEQVGALLLPAFNALIGVFQRFIDRIQEFWEVHGPAIIERLTAFKDRALELWETMKARLQPIIERVVEKLLEMKDRAFELWEQLKENLRPIIEDLVVRIKEWWEQFQEALVRFREWRDRVGPAIIESFKRLKDPIVEIWENLKETWTQLKELFGAFRSGESEGDGFLKFVDALVTVFGLLLKGINLVITAINKMLEIMRRVVESAAFKALISGIGAIGSAVGGGLSKLGGLVGLADGGIVTRPTLAMVGEGGEPEAVIPLSKMGMMGGGGVVINITTGVGDPEAIAREIRRVLADSDRRSGLRYAA